MKPSASSRRLQLSMLPLAAAMALGIPATLTAQTNGTWSNLAGSGWPTTTNWTGGVVAAGVGAVADFSTLNITANRTVTLDGARTVGTLRFGDATTVSNDQILNTGTAGPLTLDVASGKANIEVLNRTVTIGSVIAGNDGILVSNGAGGAGGTLILGLANTFTGGLDIQGSIVQFNNNGSANTGGVNNINLLTSTAVSRLVMSGGVSNASAITIENTVGVAGFGVLHYTGAGLATLSGPITVNGAPSAGGHFVGGGASANALVLSGPISTFLSSLVQREGFVRYSGGGTGYSRLLVTNTAQVGATNGIATSATVNLGPSGNSFLDLNGFDQTLAGLNLGYNIDSTAFTGTVNLGARTLTMEGDIATSTQSSTAAPHAINATAGGALNSGDVGRNLVVNDNPAPDDLTLNTAALTGTGGFIKSGSGTLALLNTSGTAPLFIDQGAISIGRTGLAGTFSVGSLTLADSSEIKADIATAGDSANVGTLTNTGVTNVTLNQLGGLLAPGDYPFLNYTGTSPGLSGFLLNPVGHTTSTLIDTGSAIALRVTANNPLIWDGTYGNNWSLGSTGNWKTISGVTATDADYIEGDEVHFPTTAITTSVDLSQAFNPSKVFFENASPADYVLTGLGGIQGGASLVKTGSGKTTLTTNNGYLGSTTLSQGTLELDHDSTGNAVLTGTSGVSTATGTTLQLTRNDGGFTFSRVLTGPATLQINPHSDLGSSTAHSVALTGNNAAFSGPVQLLTPSSGTWRVNAALPAAYGSGSIEVQDGAQVLTAANQTYPNPISIVGTGFADSAGNIGALRLEGGSVWSGPVNIIGSARIGSHNATGTVSGAISGGDLSVNATNFNNNYTVIFTGANNYGTTTIGGQNTQTAGVPSMRLNIGANGTTGTLGTGPVIINGDGANGVLGFDRSNGYTLAAGQTITGAGTNLTRTFIDVDTFNSSLNQNGNAIILGGGLPATGGQFRIAQGRANATFNANSTLTAEQIRVCTGQTGGVLNLNAGAIVTANALNIGDVANGNGILNQAADTTVNVAGQVRVGHFGTETSVYNMNGGTLTLTGDAPTLTPSTAAAGGANTTGDNNINGTATVSTHGGGIYLGIDGTGIFNHNNGNVTTNWIVLDNRTNSGPAANMPTGIDEYNLNAGTLAIRSAYGIIQRNVSAAFKLAGGTIKIDNTGTGPNTGANLAVPLDADFTVTGTGSTLDTGTATNSFLLNRSVAGTGTLNLAGGGNLRLNPAAAQTITAALAGTSPITKEGLGTTSLTGAMTAYTGPVTVQAGRLDFTSGGNPASVTTLPASGLSGEFTTTTLALDGSTVLFDPTTPGGINTTALSVNGTVLLDFSKAPLADGTYTVISYGSKTGAGTFAIAGAANYRNITVTDTGSQIQVTLGGTKQLVWKGGGASSWDINTTTNWNNAVPGPDNFFLGDSVLFDDSGTQLSVPITAGVAPSVTRVSSNTNNYTFNTTGNGISGGGGLIKEGTSTLTLAGPNTYGGRTEVSGGTLSFNSAASLGNGAVGNSILIQNGGRLSYNAATALDLGINRDIAIGAGGGALAHNNATAATITIPGRLSGTGPLSFQSNLAGAGTFLLTGNNSAYSGDITVDAPAVGTGGLTVLRPNSQQSVPAGGSITLNYPVAGANGNATTLDLPNVALPAALTLKMNSLTSGAISLRTQLTSTGDSVVNGPINLTGSGIIQFSLPSGTMTLNGNVTEGTGPFTSTMFLRGAAGTGVLNGVVTLPSAILSKTDANNWLINSTGHSWAATNIVVGSITLGIANGLATSAPLTLGQNDGNATSLNLNGFNQTVASLASNPVAAGANTTGKTITSAAPAVFTLAQETSTTYAGLITGAVSLVKNGTGTITLAGASTFTGNVNINEGVVNAAGATVTTLGSPTTAGRTITVTTPALLNFNTNNVYGNGVNNANLPTTVVDGTTLNTTRYNVLGPVSLLGGTLSQDVSDSGSYEGFQFRGPITTGGSGLSTILSVNGKANHLAADTLFTVADAVAGPDTDLVVTAPLRSQSGDYAGAAGGLTKAGPGTMELQMGSIYTGATNINAGTLRINNPSGTSATGTGVVNVNNGGTLGGAGYIADPATVIVNAGGTLSPGNNAGALSTPATTLAGGSAINWEVSDWTGSAGTGFDVIQATSLNITANSGSPVVVRVSQLALTNYTSANTSFLLASTTGGITGFDPSAFVVDASGFSAGPGSWSVTQSGNDLMLNYSTTATVAPYDAWTAAKGLTGGDAAYTADPDKDGVVNLAEFALNSEPKSPIDSGKMRVAVANISGLDYLTLTLPVRTGITFTGATELAGVGSGIRYRIQGDDNLNTWTSDIDEVTPALSTGMPILESGWIYRTFRTAAPITPGARHFIRGKFEVVP